MSSQPTDKKPQAKKSSAKKTSTKEPAGPPVPPFGDLDDKALRKLAAKLAKNPKADYFKVSKMVRDVNGGVYGSVAPILWHLVEHGLLEAESMPGVLHELDENADQGKPETIFEVFRRMGPHLDKLGTHAIEYVPGVPSYLDRLMVGGWSRNPALFEARRGELDPRLQLALAFVRRRFERDIEPAEGARILDHFANRLANGQMTGGEGLAMSRDGQTIEYRLQGEAALADLAERFGSRDELFRRAAAHALEAAEADVRQLEQTLRRADLGDVAEILARRFSWGDTAGAEQELALLESRNDSPEALFAAAEALVPGKTRGQYDSADPEDPAKQRLAVRDNLLALGAARFAAENKPVPERFEALYRFEALSDVYHPTIPRHLAAFAALPRERALALADNRLAEDYGYGPAIAVLAAHPDPERLARAVTKDRENGFVGPRYWALHGPPIIPLLEAEMAQSGSDRAARLSQAILLALATAAKQGAAVDPAWLRHTRRGSNGPEPIKYWGSADGVMRDDALDAFPPEARRATLLRAATEEDNPLHALTSRHVGADDRALVSAIVDEIVRREGARANYDQLRSVYARLGAVFVDALCDSIGRLGTDAAFLDLLRGPLPHLDHQRVLASVKGKTETLRELFVRKAAEAPGPKTRVYALDRDGDDGFTAKEGSFSRIGGSVPGLSKDRYPTHGDEPMTPILTFDLDEIPELSQKHPGARLLVLFHPDPEGGEDQDAAELVPVPRADVTTPGNGEPMAVTPLDLPTALFEDSDGRGSGAATPELQDLRRQLRKRGGHVFGGPFWIQEADGDSRGFLFQLNDGLADLNLGDVGSLYAYEGGDLIFQCH